MSGSSSSSNQSSRSSNTSSSIGIGGDLSGNMLDGNNNTITDYNGDYYSSHYENSGTVTMTHDGAFDVVEQSNNNIADVANNALLLSDSVTGRITDAANNMVEQNTLLSDSAMSRMESTFNTGAQMLDNQGERNLNAALAVHSTGLQQIQAGNELAFGLAKMNTSATQAQHERNSDSLENGFKSMMQFADSFSRSDGAKVAETNMKTVGAIAVAGVVVAYIIKKA